jgi:hypothetical protein
MEKLLTIEFEFLEQFYFSLIRVKQKNGLNEYQITVMNGDLEKLLYGNHIIREMNGHLQLELTENNKQELLKLRVAEALGKFLRIPLQVNQKHEESLY